MSETLLMCRGCLSETQLQRITSITAAVFTELTDSEYHPKDIYPQYLCIRCIQTLKKFIKFRHTCKRSATLMNQLFCRVSLNLESIREMKSNLNIVGEDLTLSRSENISYRPAKKPFHSLHFTEVQHLDIPGLQRTLQLSNKQNYGQIKQYNIILPSFVQSNYVNGIFEPQRIINLTNSQVIVDNNFCTSFRTSQSTQSCEQVIDKSKSVDDGFNNETKQFEQTNKLQHHNEKKCIDDNIQSIQKSNNSVNHQMTENNKFIMKSRSVLDKSNRNTCMASNSDAVKTYKDLLEEENELEMRQDNRKLPLQVVDANDREDKAQETELNIANRIKESQRDLTQNVDIIVKEESEKSINLENCENESESSERNINTYASHTTISKNIIKPNAFQNVVNIDQAKEKTYKELCFDNRREDLEHEKSLKELQTVANDSILTEEITQDTENDSQDTQIDVSEDFNDTKDTIVKEENLIHPIDDDDEPIVNDKESENIKTHVNSEKQYRILSCINIASSDTSSDSDSTGTSSDDEVVIQEVKPVEIDLTLDEDEKKKVEEATKVKMVSEDAQPSTSDSKGVSQQGKASAKSAPLSGSDVDSEEDLPDCLRGFNSDIYRKDTKRPFPNTDTQPNKKAKIKPADTERVTNTKNFIDLNRTKKKFLSSKNVDLNRTKKKILNSKTGGKNLPQPRKETAKLHVLERQRNREFALYKTYLKERIEKLRKFI